MYKTTNFHRFGRSEWQGLKVIYIITKGKGEKWDERKVGGCGLEDLRIGPKHNMLIGIFV